VPHLVLFLDCIPQLAEADAQRRGDALDGRPSWVGLPALDARKGSHGDTGIVREIFLCVVALLAQAAQGRREGLVGLAW
jgi:hypothetical protein